MKKYNITKEIFSMITAVLVLFTLLMLFLQHNFTFSEYNVKDHNQKIVLKYYNETYHGLVDTIDFVNEKSKRKVIFLKNKGWVVPMGQYHNLHRISAGDSIVKEPNSFVIKVYPMNSPDSLILLQPNSVIMKSIEGS